ncbi:MAG: hypothetical protein QOH43_318 [Solirubrobacteraceae bacterium]|nr:hypothetical protein [Solirubrobacteraceae bacterium]
MLRESRTQAGRGLRRPNPRRTVGRTGLEGAHGVVIMPDTPTTAGKTRTDYLGNVTLGAVGQSAARAAAVGCAPR